MVGACDNKILWTKKIKEISARLQDGLNAIVTGIFTGPIP